jgi:hypothetical protein
MNRDFKEPHWIKKVIAFNLNEQVLKNLYKAAESLKMCVYETDIPTDIIAIGAVISICDFSRMEKKKKNHVIGWFKELSFDEDFKLLFIPALKGRIPKSLSKPILKTPENADEQSLRLILLNTASSSKRRHRSRVAYDTKLKRLFHELRTLRDNGYVYTRNLCSYLDVSSRTIQRDIKLLEDMGELISYDKHNKKYLYEGTVSDI